MSEEKETKEKQGEPDKALEIFLMSFRKGRRILRRTLDSILSSSKCIICEKLVGIVSLGQEKKYCSKKCRCLRHNKKVKN